MADWEPVEALVKPLEHWGIDGPRAEAIASEIVDYDWTSGERAAIAMAIWPDASRYVALREADARVSFVSALEDIRDNPPTVAGECAWCMEDVPPVGDHKPWCAASRARAALATLQPAEETE